MFKEISSNVQEISKTSEITDKNAEAGNSAIINVTVQM